MIGVYIGVTMVWVPYMCLHYEEESIIKSKVLFLENLFDA